MAQLSRLRDFVRAGRPLLVDLITHDDWLPEEFARGEAGRYRQNLLYCDPFERFSVVSFVWGPGQCTPIHDHTVWGMVGVMRGEELCEEFVPPAVIAYAPDRSIWSRPASVTSIGSPIRRRQAMR